MLATIRIERSPNYAYQVDIEPRFGFSEVVGPWYDPAAGRSVETLKSIARGAAARLILPHIGGSKAVSEAMSAAASQRLEAEKAVGLFESAGLPEAVAGAPVEPVGYGPDIDNVDWEAFAVYHDIEPDRGWITSVETRERS